MLTPSSLLTEQTETTTVSVLLEPLNNERLRSLCGSLNENLRQIEQHMSVHIRNRANHFHLSGEEEPVHLTERLIRRLYSETKTLTAFSPETLRLRLVAAHQTVADDKDPDVTLHLPIGVIRGHTKNQRIYIRNMQNHAINFSTGPAGTGKTYLAVAAAAAALEQQKCKRIILVRPAVEAGERLGFLPGDLVQKVHPYLQPLHDALINLLGQERCDRHMSAGRIEVLPLAFMRGRTLDSAFVILDEAQNTTIEQMKMFLTRLGVQSKMTITGDPTQIDLPNEQPSGLAHASRLLQQEAGIRFTRFTGADICRHPLVARIVQAYEREQKDNGKAPAPT